MVLANEVHKFKANLQGVEFGIDMSSMAHIMSALSKLYTNPGLAVVREYISNAIDSHVEAGKNDTPIHVQLPEVSNNNVFIVRDFGLGLSHNQVEEIFSYYGKSTKRNSNDFIGAYGFGSKSAFALTDRFELLSTFNGIKTHYLIAKNEEGIPTLFTLKNETVSESNGVEIRIPLHNNYDVQAIRNGFYYWFFWYSKKVPVSVSCKIRHYLNYSKKIDGIPNATLVEINSDNHPLVESGVYVRIGQSNTYKYNELSLGSKYALLLDFNIGDIALTPSREEILDNKANTEKIENEFEKVVTKLSEINTNNLSDVLIALRNQHSYSNDIAKKLLERSYTAIRENFSDSFTVVGSSAIRRKRPMFQYPDLYSALSAISIKRVNSVVVFQEKLHKSYRKIAEKLANSSNDNVVFVVVNGDAAWNQLISSEALLKEFGVYCVSTKQAKILSSSEKSATKTPVVKLNKIYFISNKDYTYKLGEARSDVINPEKINYYIVGNNNVPSSSVYKNAPGIRQLLNTLKMFPELADKIPEHIIYVSNPYTIQTYKETKVDAIYYLKSLVDEIPHERFLEVISPLVENEAVQKSRNSYSYRLSNTAINTIEKMLSDVLPELYELTQKLKPILQFSSGGVDYEKYYIPSGIVPTIKRAESQISHYYNQLSETLLENTYYRALRGHTEDLVLLIRKLIEMEKGG